MDRGLTATVAAAALVVGGLLFFGYKRALSVAGAEPPRATPALPKGAPLSPAADPEPVPSQTPYPTHPGGAPAVTVQAEGRPAPPSPEDVWLFDGAVLATRSLDDWAVFLREESRPGIGTAVGVRRNKDDYTPDQRRLLLSGRIVVVPEAARVEVLQVTDTLAEVRVRDGEKAGSRGWISRHHLLLNRDGNFVPVYPVRVQ